MVAAILLIRSSETSLVKLIDLVNCLILIAPMLGRNLDDTPEHVVPKWEKSYINSMPYNVLVDDFEKKDAERDSILYPFNISDEEAA